MDYFLAKIDQLEKDKNFLLKENKLLKQKLSEQKDKYNVLNASYEIIYSNNREEYFKSKK